MSLRSAFVLSILALGLAACDGGGGGDDAGVGDAALPDAGQPLTCTVVTQLTGVIDSMVSVMLDTTMTEERPRDLGLTCGNPEAELRWAPQEVIEFTVPGPATETFGVEFRSNLPGTDMNFNTVIQVRDTCETAPQGRFPPRCFDDIAMDELRSEGAVTVAGGTVLYFIVTGYSEPPAAQMTVDSGVVEVDFFVRASTPPTIASAFLRLVADDVRIEVTGNDPNADVRGVAMNYYGPDGALLDIYGDGAATEDGDVFTVRFDSPVATGFDYTGGAWVRAADINLGPYLRGAGATRVRFRVYDAAWGVSEPFDADIAEAVSVGFGEPCDDMIFCRPEMVCTAGACAPSAPIAVMCDGATELAVAANPLTAVSASTTGTIGAGMGLIGIAATCAADGSPTSGAGAEKAYKIDVAIPNFDLLITTDLPGTAMMTDTMVYVRSNCADSGTTLDCNDDIGAMNLHSDLELRDLTAGTYYAFVEIYGGVPMGTVAHEIRVTVRPLIASGGACDMAGVENRCRTGACTAAMCP